ncbi:Biofilm PGA synthesis protein PgaD OS=Castellaniella defragrans OX=75697 GN=HNR28_002556 PE=4 SV=1 [Castellaniella defragrans]
MMIIKTPRSRLFALIDAVLTALAWLIFLYLFGAGILAITAGEAQGIAVPVFSNLLPSMLTLLAYGVVAAGIALVLALWAQYNAIRFGSLERRKAARTVTDDQLAQGFDVTPEAIGRLRASRRAAIHHAEDGRIQLIDIESPALVRTQNVKIATIH